MLGRLMDRFADATQVSRKRGGSSVFFHGRAALSDRIVNRLFFEAAAARWDRASADPAHLVQLHDGLARCRVPTRVLDIGTGAGRSAAAAADRWPEAEVVAIDLSRGMLRHARALHRQPNLSFRHASAERLPFDDGSFDLVVLLHAICYPPEVRRVLAPAGQVLSASAIFDFSPLGAGDPWAVAGFDVVDHRSIEAGHWVLLEPAEARDGGA